jgi:hypothetical protein
VRHFHEFPYAAKSWDRQPRVIVKAERLEQGPNVRFVLTNLDAPPATIYDASRRPPSRDPHEHRGGRAAGCAAHAGGDRPAKYGGVSQTRLARWAGRALPLPDGQVEILRGKLDGNRVIPSPDDRARVLAIGQEFDHNVADVIGIVTPQTDRRWVMVLRKGRWWERGGRPKIARKRAHPPPTVSPRIAVSSLPRRGPSSRGPTQLLLDLERI